MRCHVNIYPKISMENADWLKNKFLGKKIKTVELEL